MGNNAGDGHDIFRTCSQGDEPCYGGTIDGHVPDQRTDIFDDMARATRSDRWSVRTQNPACDA